MGKLIVIEGLDGSGKATQTELLARAMTREGVSVRTVSFPDYASESSALVKMYLAGAFGRDPGDVNAYAASSFYAVDRYASFRRDWGAFYENGGIVLADRYTTSNGVHQCSKLPREEWDGFLDWLNHYEYELLGIPRPDLVLYLQVEPERSQELMTRRYQGSEEKKDIHESNLDYLRRSGEAAEHCCDYLGWQRVRCTRDGEMRQPSEICRELLELTRPLWDA